MFGFNRFMASLAVTLLAPTVVACGGGGDATSTGAVGGAPASSTGAGGTTAASTSGASSGGAGGVGPGGASSSGTSTATSTSSSSSGSGGGSGVVADDGLMGWATKHPNGPPTGGFEAIGGNAPVTCTAADMKTLRDCLFRSRKSNNTNVDTRPNKPDWSTWEVHNGVTTGWKNYPVVIYIKGVIDANVNDLGVTLTKADYEAGTDGLCAATGHKQQPCQQDVTQAKVERGNISIIGIPGDNNESPTLLSGWLLFNSQDNLIVRNVRFVGATDFWTKFEACSAGIADTDYCSWNAEPDGLTFVDSHRVWVDHCEFTDGADLQGAQTDKSLYKYYDGLLDIKSGSDFLTLSYNQFYNHNKAMLVGATDSADGNYDITFHHNYIKWVQQRMPRVRNGQVHVLNNVYEGPKKTDYKQEYYFGYAIGLGFNSRVYSEGNAFDVTGAVATDLLSANFDAWGQRFTDVGSWLNGASVDLNAAAATVVNAKNAGGATPFLGPVQWKPSDAYPYTSDASESAVRDKVINSAGIGKVKPVPSPYAP